jgi:hypothetical protein
LSTLPEWWLRLVCLDPHVNLPPSLQNTARKSDAPGIAALIRVKPPHKVSHVPSNLASLRAVLDAKDASWGRAAK